jgi:hypothetical protein
LSFRYCLCFFLKCLPVPRLKLLILSPFICLGSCNHYSSAYSSLLCSCILHSINPCV